MQITEGCYLSMLTIRPFNSEDTHGVASLIIPIQQHEFGISITLDAQPDLLDIAGFYQKDNGNFWVAETEGVIVGTIGLLDIGNNQAALRKMFVAENFRGPELGIAKQLLNALLNWAMSKKFAQIYLGTTAKFLAAHRFYEKNGFLEVQKSELPPTFPIMVVDTKFYSRILAQNSNAFQKV
jgi:N-acetylglutamate synthase-like GNAT family acetyltransferase